MTIEQCVVIVTIRMSPIVVGYGEDVAQFTTRTETTFTS